MLTNLLVVDARPYSPFPAILLSPQLFRVKVSERALAQLVRQCITHLLPVRPTGVGRTDLAARGVPKSVSLGELTGPSTSGPDTPVTEKRREPVASAFRVSGLFSGVSASLPLPPPLSGSTESIRGASATLGFTLARRNSPTKTLRLSGNHTPKSYHHSYTRGYEQSPASSVQASALSAKMVCQPLPSSVATIGSPSMRKNAFRSRAKSSRRFLFLRPASGLFQVSTP